ncbi:hypothetical protein ACHAXS_000037 [Conticribra weissflogii]
MFMVENKFQDGDLVADAFCGVGALCSRAVKEKRCGVVGNNWNNEEVGCLRDSARKNGIQVLAEESEEEEEEEENVENGKEGMLRV